MAWKESMFGLRSKLAIIFVAIVSCAVPAQSKHSERNLMREAAKIATPASIPARLRNGMDLHLGREFNIERGKIVGYTVELVVSCVGGNGKSRSSGIITFAVLDKTFCQPNRTCHGTANQAARAVCTSMSAQR